MILQTYHFDEHKNDRIFLAYIQSLNLAVGDFYSKKDYMEFRKDSVKSYCEANRIPFPLNENSRIRLKYLGIKNGDDLLKRVADEIEKENQTQLFLF